MSIGALYRARTNIILGFTELRTHSTPNPTPPPPRTRLNTIWTSLYIDIDAFGRQVMNTTGRSLMTVISVINNKNIGKARIAGSDYDKIIK